MTETLLALAGRKLGIRWLHRFAGNSMRVLRRWWWIASGERQRVIEERDRYKAWGDVQFDRARAAEHAVYMLQADCLPASVDTLRFVADAIDCGDRCEHVSPLDWSTGVSECHLSDRGECPFDRACELRDLANALETVAALRSLAGGA